MSPFKAGLWDSPVGSSGLGHLCHWGLKRRTSRSTRRRVTQTSMSRQHVQYKDENAENGRQKAIAI